MSNIKKKKILRYIFFFSFFGTAYLKSCIFYTRSTSQFGLATFQVLASHGWPRLPYWTEQHWTICRSQSPPGMVSGEGQSTGGDMQPRVSPPPHKNPMSFPRCESVSEPGRLRTRPSQNPCKTCCMERSHSSCPACAVTPPSSCRCPLWLEKQLSKDDKEKREQDLPRAEE